MLELKPIKVMFNRYAREVYENFTCSYHSSEPLHITITREPTWVDKDSHPAALSAAEAPHSTDEYTNGARHYSLLRLLHGHRRVTCRVYDSSNKEVAQMVSQILYTNNNWRLQSKSFSCDFTDHTLTVQYYHMCIPGFLLFQTLYSKLTSPIEIHL